MKVMQLVVVSFILGWAISSSIGATSVRADETSPTQETALALRTVPLLDDKGKPVEGRILIVAELTATDGQPVSDVEVTYYEQIEFMGSLRNAELGRAVTDVTGTGAIAYQPATAGPHIVWARFAGGTTYAATDSESFVIRVEEVMPVFESAPVPFATVRRWLPWGVGILILGTWLTVVGVFLRTALGIRSARQRADVDAVSVPERHRSVG